MATRQEAQEHIMDLILNFIIDNAVDGAGVQFDLSNYKRYINQATGQITIGTPPSADSNIVLYEKDFSKSASDYLSGIIDMIVDNCLTITDGDYTLADIDSGDWVYIPGGNNCQNFTDITDELIYGGISFSGANGEDIPSSGGPCTYKYGGTACGSTGETPIGLKITYDVLDSLTQFIKIIQEESNIDPTLAGEVLDTNIYELLPTSTTRQEQIDKFFADYNNLKGTIPNTWDEDYDGDNIPDHWSNQTLDDNYTQNHDITFNPLGFIPRLDEDVIGTVNEGQTLQSLRDDLNNFLLDIDSQIPSPEIGLGRYENQADSYLKFRGLNQAIIIRNTEGIDVGLEEYYDTGFTVTMWVRFLDKVSSGTLFNYGNPLRDGNPIGFMLETIVDTDTDPDNRYVRLVLRDAKSGGKLRDSHVGNITNSRQNTNAMSNLDSIDITSYTPIPIDFKEWYFVVATFDATIDEDNSFYLTYGTCEGSDCDKDEDFWRNNINEQGFVTNSGNGAMCKVEVISRSDLIRARGLKV